MKVVLLQDIKKLGKKYDTTNVPDGYALNFLIPQQKAIPANDPKAKQVLTQVKTKEVAKADQVAKIKEILSSKKILIQAPTNEDGQLYGSIDEKQIAKLLKEQLGVNLETKKINLKDPIKHIGTFRAMVDVGYESVTLNIQVEANK